MIHVVKNSFLEEYGKVFKTKLYISFNNDGTMQKSFNSSLHPRDEHGRFTEKGVMELTEEERQELLDYLEKEEYENYNGFHISVNKIAAVKADLYKEEVYACEVLAKQGFDVYLLDEKYVGGRKADTFFKKDGDREFLELKQTNGKKITSRYNDSVEQSPSCFIVVDGYMSKVQKANLENAICNNTSAKSVYVYLKNSDKFLQLK